MSLRHVGRARRRVLAAAVAAMPLLGTAAMADPVTDFYRGRTVTINVGFGSGGGYDTYARVLARHYGRHIPGQPKVVVRNMPGAGALRAANYIYGAAPKTGTELGLVGASTLMEPLLGNDKAQFVAAGFTWIGSMTRDVALCSVWHTTGIDSFEAWLSSKKELTFGATGPAAITYQHPLIMKNLFGANAKPLAGYKGTKEVSLALQRGEVDGLCGLFVSSIKAQYQQLVDKGQMRLILQMGPNRTDAFGPVPSVYDYAGSDVQRQVLDIHFGQLLLARPFIAPPGVPAERAHALRKAFMEALRSPELTADAEKTRVSIDPVSADEALNLLVRFADFPPEAIAQAKKAIGR